MSSRGVKSTLTKSTATSDTRRAEAQRARAASDPKRAITSMDLALAKKSAAGTKRGRENDGPDDAPTEGVRVHVVCALADDCTACPLSPLAHSLTPSTFHDRNSQRPPAPHTAASSARRRPRSTRKISQSCQLSHQLRPRLHSPLQKLLN